MIKVNVKSGLFEKTINVPGYDRLTPRACRAALEIADVRSGGTVWFGDEGYRIYPKSARKVTK